MGRVARFFKWTLAGTLFPTAAFVGYRKREIGEINQRKAAEVEKLHSEVAALGPHYTGLIAAQQRALDEAVDQEKLKVTLWEDRLRRFKAETEEFLKYGAVLPEQLQDLENLNKMYWLVSNVLQDSRLEEVKFEAVCRQVHFALLAGHDVLLQPDTVTSKADVVKAIHEANRRVPDPLLDRLLETANQLEDHSVDALHRIEQQFLEGLRLIERTQFSIQGPEQSDLMARVFSKAQQSLRFANGEGPASPLTAPAPKKFITEGEVRAGLRFAEAFVADAAAGRVAVQVTAVPIRATPEGADAIRFLERWAAGARAYLSQRQLLRALDAHLTAQAVRLGLPEVAAVAEG